MVSHAVWKTWPSGLSYDKNLGLRPRFLSTESLGPCFSHGMGDHDQILQHTPNLLTPMDDQFPNYNKTPKTSSLPISQYTFNKYLKLSLRYYDLVMTYGSWSITGFNNGLSKRETAFIRTNADVSLPTQPGIHPNEYSMSLWRHQMETFYALLALCAGNSLVTGEFASQRPVTRSFGVFFDLLDHYVMICCSPFY